MKKNHLGLAVLLMGLQALYIVADFKAGRVFSQTYVALSTWFCGSWVPGMALFHALGILGIVLFFAGGAPKVPRTA